MKKVTLLILFCFFAGFFSKAVAQSELPKASTAENPIWYYVQVEGTDAARKGRIFGNSSDDLYGIEFSSLTTSQRRNAALFRFEKNTDGSYKIINKLKNKELDTRVNGTSTIGTFVESSALSWNLNAYNDAYQIVSSAGKYLFVGGSTTEYIVTAVASGTSKNALFNFQVYDSTTPEISDGTDVWYRIFTAETENRNKCIVDINAVGSSAVKFKLIDRSEGNYAQHWKIIQPVNGTSNTLLFVNRATGNIIQTSYDFNGYFNAQSTSDEEESNGWKLTFIDMDQFKISGLDDTGKTGYLNVSSTKKDVELIPANSEFLNSAYAWRFTLVDPDEEKVSSIDNIETDISSSFDNVRVENRRIIVEGVGEYTISHISGIRVQKDIELPVGIYLVTINGKTKSYLVK